MYVCGHRCVCAFVTPSLKVHLQTYLYAYVMYTGAHTKNMPSIHVMCVRVCVCVGCVCVCVRMHAWMDGCMYVTVKYGMV